MLDSQLLGSSVNMFRGFNLNDLETSGDEATTSSQTSASDDLRRFHENIVKAAEKANYEVALRHVNEALLSFPNKLWLQLHKAYFLVLTYKSDEANETLMEILKNDPLNATAIAILAILFYYQGNLRKSVEVLHNVQEADSETLINTYKRKAQKLIKILDSSKFFVVFYHSLRQEICFCLFSSRCRKSEGEVYRCRHADDCRWSES